MSQRARRRKPPSVPGAVPPAAARPASERRWDWPAALCLAALVAVVHGRALTFGFTGTDDTLQVVDDGPFLSRLANVPRAFGRGLFAVGGAEGYYRPVVTLSYMLDAQWAGPRPGAYHATNLVLHALTVVLLFHFGRRLGFSREIAGAASAVFAVHPSVAEAAAWIPARGDDLLGVWLAGAMLALLAFQQTRSGRALALHLGLFVLALFTKENAVVLPALFVAFGFLAGGDRAWLRDRRLWTGWLAALLLWFACWRSVMAEALRYGPGATDVVRNLPLLVLCFGQAVNPFHPAALASAADTPWLAGLLALGAIAAVAVIVPPPRRGLVLWGAAAFALLLLPALTVSDFLILEHRLYAPWLGLFLVLLAVAQTLAERGEKAGRRVLGAAAVLVVALALLAFDYGGAFRNAETFTAQAAASSPRSSLARVSRGIVLQDAGRASEAQQEYEAALRANPRQLRAHANLGGLAYRGGDLARAERLFREELDLNPKDDVAGYDLGVVLARQGRWAEAEAALRRALDANPGNATARAALSDLARRRSTAH